MRWVVRIAIGLLVVVALLVGGIRAMSYFRTHRTFAVPRLAVILPTDSSSLRRGEHLMKAIARCGDCHGADLGGAVFVDDSRYGRFIAPNLTRGRGGVGASLSDADIVTAIRHGVGPDNRALLFMPSEAFSALSTTDMLALVAYLRRQPGVNRDPGPSRTGPLGHLLLGIHVFPIAAETIDHQRTPADSVVQAVLAAYGNYLADIGGCRGCHNAALSGQHVPGTPPTFKNAPNITRGGIPDWTLGDFRRLLREGKTPEGTVVDSFMPYRATRLMTDDEINALWLYVRAVPAMKFNQRH